MRLGIEIGGTKLQLGVGAGGGGPLVELARCDVEAQRGAGGILDQIAQTAPALVRKHAVSQIGIGFGGPVDSARGVVTKSHQVAGWDAFPLAQWCRDTLGLSAVVGNDCDAAALAEARFGAGKGAASVFYVTVGTGIGGGLVLNGRLHGAGRPAVAEIGHLRPGLDALRADMTVESLASGPAIATAARARLSGDKGASKPDVADLRERCGGNDEGLTAKLVAEAAAAGNNAAIQVLNDAVQALGWAIAQVITVVAPEIIVVGGGVSLIGEALFFAPLRAAVQQYVFPPLAGSYQIVPAGLGELAVVYGAIALAGDQPAATGRG